MDCAALIDQLQCPEVSARRDAARELRVHPIPQAELALVRSLGDPSPGVREASAESLRAIGSRVAVDALIDCLRSPNVSLRNLAIDLLGHLGPVAAPAVAHLVRDADPDVRKFAADILGVINDSAFLPSLLTLLTDSNLNVRQAAVEALGRLGDRRAIGPLVSLLAEPNPLWYAIASALGRIGDPTVVLTLLDRLAEADSVSFVGLVETLGQLGDRDTMRRIVRQLEGQIASPDPDARFKSAALLRTLLRVANRLGEPVPIVPDQTVRWLLEDLLAEGDSEVILWAIEAYAPQIPGEQFPALLTMAGDLSEEPRRRLVAMIAGLVRSGATFPLALLETTPPDVHGEFLTAFLAEPSDARHSLLRRLPALPAELAWDVAEAFGRAGESRVIPTLLAMLRQDDPSVQLRAAGALAELRAREAVPTLLSLLEGDREEADLRAFATALVTIDPSSLLARLPSFLAHGSPFLRRAAVDVLTLLDHHGIEAHLLPLLRDPDSVVRQRAVELLGRLGGPGGWDSLLLALLDEDPGVRRAAVRGLALIDPAQAFEPIESAFLQEADPWVRYEIIISLREFSAEKAKALLLEALADPVPLVRAAAARAFGVTGDPGDDEPLRQLLQHPDPAIRLALSRRARRP